MKRFISIVSVFVLMLFSTSSVLASSKTGYELNQEEMLKELNNFEEIDDENTINELKSEFESFSQSLTVNHNLLNYDQAKAYNVKDSDIKTLTVPVTDGENYHEISNISVYFDNTGKVLDYSEAYLTKSDKNTFKIELIVNGEVLTEEVTNDEFTTAKDYQEQQGNELVQPAGVNWDSFLDCMGIPGVTASVISSACGVACAITAGAGCIACASFVLGLNGGSIVGCLSSSWE